MNRKTEQAARSVAREKGATVTFEEGQKHTIATFAFEGRFVDVNIARGTNDDAGLKRMLRSKLR